jgi:hypothetical protein
MARINAKRHWTAADRLAFRAKRDETTGCLIWTGAVAKGGYGNIGWKGRTYGAHRLAWELVNGPIPDGMVICHQCDVRTCINPAHMRVGTPTDNGSDKVKRGRQPKGEFAAQAKLTDAAVRAIRSGEIDPRSATHRFDVCRATVRDVILGETWKHIR